MGFELIVVAVIGFILWKKIKRPRVSKTREKYIQEYRYPKRIREKVKERYPHLSDAQINRVMRGLKEYFVLCLMAHNKLVAMPSQVVDVAWHEFILFTRDYGLFCKKALGNFLHHTPTEAMRTPTSASAGIKRAWRLACARENIDPKKPEKIPLLFILDRELAIPDGFKYVPDCTKSSGADNYCGSHIGCSSGCSGSSGSDSGFFGRDSGSDDSHGSHHSSGNDVSDGSNDSGGGSDSSGCGGGCGGGGGD